MLWILTIFKITVLAWYFNCTEVICKPLLFIPDSLEDCDQCQAILEELENIDDDCDRHGIVFVKTQVE